MFRVVRLPPHHRTRRGWGASAPLGYRLATEPLREHGRWGASLRRKRAPVSGGWLAFGGGVRICDAWRGCTRLM
ncbi:MAG: hypothetical protein ACI391_06770, partial [Muribaculaceae bacterium]